MDKTEFINGATLRIGRFFSGQKIICTKNFHNFRVGEIYDVQEKFGKFIFNFILNEGKVYQLDGPIEDCFDVITIYKTGTYEITPIKPEFQNYFDRVNIIHINKNNFESVGLAYRNENEQDYKYGIFCMKKGIELSALYCYFLNHKVSNYIGEIE